MLADTAIAVHPDDERYTRLVGETAELPLVGRRLRIIADPYVKPEFGTGALKITPGHDPNDFEIGRAHGLEEIVVIGEDGRMTEAAGERFAGLTALEAREAVVAALREEGRIVRTEPYTHNVPVLAPLGRADRAAHLPAVVHAHGRRWRAPAIAAVEDGRVRIHPESQRRRYLEWLANIRPWCISRQLWWGHQIPVWYRGEETYVGSSRREGEGWERDPDVLDTWFSSGLWPFATLGWPDDTPELRAFYPTDVLSTARDILFLWVARMVMLGLEFARRRAVRRRLRPLDDPRPRRAADVQVAGHGHRPARPDRRPRRGRGALRPAGHVLHAGRALLGGEGRCRASSSPTSSSTPRGSCSCACPRA